jgi:uncharacterized membrane protein
VRRREARTILYDVCKTLHLVGVVLLLGNVTATSVWKVFADRSGDPRIIAHAQRLVTITDWMLTLSGIVLVIGGGFGAAYVAGMPWVGVPWCLSRSSRRGRRGRLVTAEKSRKPIGETAGGG